MISEFNSFPLVFIDKSAANERVGDQQCVSGPTGIETLNLLPFSKGGKYWIFPALN